jgi:dihydroorotate dehydrogenase electron transfer subunit
LIRRRGADSASAEAIAALGRASLASAWSPEAIADFLARDDAFLFTAEREGALEGYLTASAAGGESEIHELAVAAARRRRGVGTALLDAALDALARAGARTVHLEVRAGDADAVAFYRERRFREIGRRARYYRDGEDAIRMSRTVGPPKVTVGPLKVTVGPTPLRVDAEVVENVRDGASGLRLRLRVPGWPGAGPGQFVMLSPGARGAAPRTDPLLPRPMAVYRSDGEAIDVLYKVSGRGTALLAEAAPGARVGLVGPLGRGFAPPAEGEHAVLVGGGTGTASLLDQAAAAARVGRATVLLGARSADDLLGVADFRALDADVEVATEDGSAGHHGLVTEPLAKILAADPDCVVYACGPTPMMRAAAALARAHDARCLVSLENPMACGFGVCLGCAAPLAGGGFALVCRDGPVFEADAVDWENLS